MSYTVELRCSLGCFFWKHGSAKHLSAHLKKGSPKNTGVMRRKYYSLHEEEESKEIQK